MDWLQTYLNPKTVIIAFTMAILASAVIIAGCTDAGQTGPSEQVLTIGMSTDVPLWQNSNFPGGDGRFVWSQIYETLVRVDTDLNIEPGLATSWDTPDDGKTWFFYLRDGVIFHDGTPLNADAVVYSYNENSYVRAQGALQTIASVEAVDDLTVKFVMKRPQPLPLYLTHVAWPVVSPTCVDSNGNFIKPIGTGPYAFESHTKAQQVVLTKNENYWGTAPTLDMVIFKVIPEASTRVMALETGEVDMIIKVPESDCIRLENTPGITVSRKVSTFTDFLQFNTKTSPFDDIRVRKAVAYAIDTEEMSETILEGIGIAARGRPYSPVMLYSNPDLALYSQDPAKSRQLLEEAGWTLSGTDTIRKKDGRELKVSILVGRGVWAARHIQMAEAAQSYLSDVGMGLEVKVLEDGALNQLESAGDFGMILRSGYFVWGPYPRHFWLHSSQYPNSHYQNEEYDRIATAADTTGDETRQKELYYQLQDMVIEDLPAFYLIHEEKIVATNDHIQGYTITSEDPWLNLAGITVR
ncbi:ABC transporter substrate-binding protein [Methanocalculus taiwanensis]|uniref:ABC transporter substrate-binding protein n=1 Tax=Methanocalculus taiwanensis TaxID=106207 RepID=A0ABD4TJ76_9EURY|nr:ABC transporter substrate-binding protein [Methanocalculus taiwanensis]MCQ1537405.1 ABC transporter substrate-binding protein [Methanocalculus taiwanensis]